MVVAKIAEAWVTLAKNDSYALGAMVLAQSLHRVFTTRQLVVMVPNVVSPATRSLLASLFNAVIEVNVLDSGDAVNLALLTRPDLGITFTKLHCWRLTQFTKCVFLDADTLIPRNQSLVPKGIEKSTEEVLTEEILELENQLVNLEERMERRIAELESVVKHLEIALSNAQLETTALKEINVQLTLRNIQLEGGGDHHNRLSSRQPAFSTV